ncbi:MAG: hypothetical protein WKG07_19955 [Hymenobacter sp.]
MPASPTFRTAWWPGRERRWWPSAGPPYFSSAGNNGDQSYENAAPAFVVGAAA